MKRLRFGLKTKFAITFTLLMLLTMAIVYFAVQKIIIAEFTLEYRRDVQSSLAAIQKELSNRQHRIKQRLRELAVRLSDDNDFRLHLSVLGNIHHPYLVDYASNHMKTMGLDALEIATKSGLVLSSGHHRNAFGRNVYGTIRFLQSTNGPGKGGKKGSIVWFHRISGEFPALASLDSLFLGNKKLYVIGGIEVNNSILNAINQDSTNSLVARFDTLLISSNPAWEHFAQLRRLSFETSEDSLPEWIQANFTIGYFQVPMVVPGTLRAAEFILFHPKSRLTMLLDNLRKNILLIFGLGILIAIILSIWRTRAVVKPLSQLASKASELSLDNLEFHFNSKRTDEVGLLSKALNRMVSRLRQSRIKLAAAEQKAARAEIARQVNHDLKNGFLPIRHVLEHWEEVSISDPQKLVQVFDERKSTIKESLKYLEDLSKSYTKIQPTMKPISVNINQLLQQLITNYQDFPENRIRFEIQFDAGEPTVRADKIQLRRAFENILCNAIEAINEEGNITISTAMQNNKVIVAFKDTGCGIPEDIKKILFTSNISTKSGGSGIGLNNVKRIIEDFGGSINIESANGKGTIVEIALPGVDVSSKSVNDI